MQPERITLSRWTLSHILSEAHYQTTAWRAAYHMALRGQRRRNPSDRYGLTDPLMLESLPRLITLARSRDQISNPIRQKGFNILQDYRPAQPNRLFYLDGFAEAIRNQNR